ncbi:MAG: hypothetical protein LBS74_09995 [Oscillospiraceae bacterium]|nr:hypothetical protein [Oscillospiraceae bacterium]
MSNKIKALLKASSRWLILYVGIILVFWLLLSIVYAIPESWIEANRTDGINRLWDAGNLPEVDVKGGIIIDNHTDRLMLEFANSKGANPFVKSMVEDYARYWHGYQIFTRPALVFGGLSQMRFWSTVIHLSMLTVLLILIYKRLGTWVSFAFGFSLAAVDYWIVPVCFQFSHVFLITFAACIVLLLCYNKPWFRRSLPMFFFIVGAVTVYIDFLTAPFISVGIPLVILQLLRNSENKKKLTSPLLKKDILPDFLTLLKNGFAWCVGYVSIWAGKWLLASIVFGRNEFAISFQQILLRTGQSNFGYDSGNESELSFGTWKTSNDTPIDMVVACIRNMFSLTEWLLIILLLLAIVVVTLRKKNRARSIFFNLLPFAALALGAPAWLLLLSNHTLIHSFMVYRNLLVSVFAVLCAVNIPLNLAIDDFKHKRKAVNSD